MCPDFHSRQIVLVFASLAQGLEFNKWEFAWQGAGLKPAKGTDQPHTEGWLT
jgi:hypothetical protein